MEYEIVPGYWGDCGESFESYLRVTNLVAQRGANKALPLAEAAAR
jgi:hypothetical protein